jgi:dimethylglycine dehydrogenase
MGYVRPEVAVPKQALKVRIMGELWDARITEDSPYDPKNEKIRADG